MKIRVWIDTDPRSSHLFENVDKVIDGTGNATHMVSIEGENRKLVLMRERYASKNATATSKDVPYDTIAVFNHWTFWRLIGDEEQKEEAKTKKQQEEDNEEKHRPDKIRY